MSWPSRVRAVVLAAAAASLAACAAVGPDFQTPQAPAAAGYAMAGDAAPALVALSADTRAAGPWWTALGSRQLDATMAQALAGNQTVAAADATLARAQAQLSAAEGGRRPQADGQASLQGERFNLSAFGINGFPNPTVALFNVGATVSYDLDLFGGQRRRVETAAAAAEAEARRADAAWLTLTGNVALQAVAIAAARARIDAVHAIVADDQRDIDIVQAAEAAGGEPPSATAAGKAQIAQDQALLPPLEQDLARARHALALLVGAPASAWTAPDFAFEAFTPPAAIPVALPSRLVRRRPDILAAEADLHADVARVGVATADLYPDIRLTAGFAQTSADFGSLFGYGASGWNIGPELTTPLFHGGTLKARRRAAEAQARVSLAQYRQTVLTAFTQVSDVLAALAHDDDAIATAERSLGVARSSLDYMRAAWRLGGGAFLPVVQAQRQVNRARLTLVEARGRRLADIVSLYAATAADWRGEAKVAG